jgi:hypothetical protein
LSARFDLSQLEYHRQGFHEQFEQLLTEIVGALEDPGNCPLLIGEER